MNTKMIISSLFLLSLHLYGNGFESSFTSIEEKDCKTLQSDENGTLQACTGFANLQVELVENNLSQSITLIRDANSSYPQDFNETVASGMSTLGKTIEWRYKKGDEEHPIAMITRLNVSENPEKPEEVTSYLVVSKIVEQDICVVDKIKPEENQNEKARLVAQESAELPCLNTKASDDTNNTSQLIGSWGQAIAGLSNEMQGFILKADGSASSINMDTLIYSSWEAKGNQLILTATTLNNGVEMETKEVYEYSFCENNHLCLQHPNADEVVKYTYQAIDTLI